MNDLDATVRELLAGRRTINSFRTERVPTDVIREAIDLARWAPNHRLTEPWNFYVLGEETAQRVAERNAELVATSKGEVAGRKKLERWSAMPGWLVVTHDRSPDDALRDREDYAATCCAVHNLSLALWSRGVGVKWTTGAVTRDERFAAIVGFDPGAERVVGLFWYGIPESVPRVRRCKSVDDILIERP